MKPTTQKFFAELSKKRPEKYNFMLRALNEIIKL